MSAFLAYLLMRSSALETSAARWWTCLLRAWYSSTLAWIHLCGITLRVAGCKICSYLQTDLANIRAE